MKPRILFALVFLFLASAAVAGAGEKPEAFLRRLYAAHQPWAHKDAMSDASLPKFFDENLVRLILADRNCKAPDWGVGNLDFDPILSGQDFGDNGIGDLKIRRITGGTAEKYEVSFLLFPGVSAERATLVYRLVNSSRGWRVADIEYDKTSLLQILAPPCQ